MSEIERLRAALEAAYHHLDTFGALSGGKPEEMASQEEFFNLYHDAKRQEPPVLSGHKDVLTALDEAREVLREIAADLRNLAILTKDPVVQNLLFQAAEKASAAHGKTFLYPSERE